MQQPLGKLSQVMQDYHKRKSNNRILELLASPIPNCRRLDFDRSLHRSPSAKQKKQRELVSSQETHDIYTVKL